MTAEDEVVDECLGFLSSVAEANHTPVHNSECSFILIHTCVSTLHEAI